MTAAATLYHQQRLNNMRCEALNRTELRALRLIAEGTPDKGIAAQMNMTLPATKWVLREMRAKLGAHDRANAVHIAWQQGLLGGEQ